MTPLAPIGALLLLLATPTLANETEPDFLAIQREFKLSFSSGSCPEKFLLTKPPKSSGLTFPVVKRIPSRAIVEDGVGCPPTDPAFLLAWAGGFRTAEYLKALRYPRAEAGLAQNANARAFLDALKGAPGNFRSFFGFSEGQRICRSNKYLSGTFFFFNNVSSILPVALKDAAGGARTITVPANAPTLVILGPKGKICVLGDGGRTVGGAAPAAPAGAGRGSAAKRESGKPSSAAVNETSGATPIVGGDTTAPADSPSPIDAEGSVPEGSPAASDSNPVCFPASATVELASGDRVPMADLRIGDRVRTGPASFSDVFLFTHRDAVIRSNFVRLLTVAGSSITLTKSHYLYSNGALVAAESVRIGDVLELADGSDSPVVAVESVSSVGLYNPQTVDGNIVVEGVVASAYTTAVHPRVAHSALLAPVRFLYERLPASFAVLDALAGLISGSTNTLARAVPGGPVALA